MGEHNWNVVVLVDEGFGIGVNEVILADDSVGVEVNEAVAMEVVVAVEATAVETRRSWLV